MIDILNSWIQKTEPIRKEMREKRIQLYKNYYLKIELWVFLSLLFLLLIYIFPELKEDILRIKDIAISLL